MAETSSRLRGASESWWCVGRERRRAASRGMQGRGWEGDGARRARRKEETRHTGERVVLACADE